MKTMSLFGIAAAFAVLVMSCKKGETAHEEAVSTEASVYKSTADTLNNASSSDAKSVLNEKSGDASLKNVLSSNAAVQNPNDKRKFIRTADIKFKVKNVAQSTYKIENAVVKFGGIVTNTDLQSNISEKKQSKISVDSTLQSIKYSVVNNITLRIPNAKLDTVIKSIANEIDYLDFRVIKADDVSLQLLAADLTQQRIADHTKRLQKGIDTKGRKLGDITEAENDVLNKKEQSDQSKIENLAMQDQILYSTITLAIYQNEVVKYEMLAVEKDHKAYGNFGLEILDGLKTGWYILASIITFVVQLWSIIALAALAILVYKKYLRQRPINGKLNS